MDCPICGTQLRRLREIASIVVWYCPEHHCEEEVWVYKERRTRVGESLVLRVPADDAVSPD